jgi:uncharacterized protein YecE (DUF72 family)
VDEQLGLFSDHDPGTAAPVAPALQPPDVVALGARLPARIHLGTSSWSFPGWEGLVYDRRASEATLARHGLAAYAQHPLFRTVGVDRTYYAPIPAARWAEYAAALPAGFRCLVKAHEALTSWSPPERALAAVRAAGAPQALLRGGPDSPLFLDPGYAEGAVIGPAVQGLGDRLGPIVFQLPPQPVTVLGGPEGFARRLGRFLQALPRGPLYAVELRTRALLTPAYARVLAEAGACHCLNVHPTMPDLRTQARLAAPALERALVVRWMLGGGLAYQEARERFAPFTEVVDPDPSARGAIGELAASAPERPVYVVVNNKAEGCAPGTVRALADLLVDLVGAETR